MKQRDALADLIKKRSPAMDPGQMIALATVWAEMSDRIIQRMLDLGRAEFGPNIHDDCRPEAIFEIARLMLFLNRKILDQKERDRPIVEHDPAAERAYLVSEEGRAMIEGTAHILADGAWKPALQRWRTYRPLIERPAPKHPPRRLRKGSEPHRTRMHYVPQFSTKPWVDPKTGKFDVHTIGIDGEVDGRHGTAKVWGATDYLYTQKLETRFGEIERDGREPFRKLARSIPLSDLERRFWIAFLVSQLLRPPREMARIMAGLRRFIATNGIDYPTEPAHLARAFETAFEANEIYALFHDLIMDRVWQIVVAGPDSAFLKADNPVALSGSTRTGDWSLVFPLTPKKCFVVGPALATGEPGLIPRRIELDTTRTAGFNAIICANAETSVISTHGAVDSAFNQIIKTHLGTNRRSGAQPLPYWGYDSGRVNGQNAARPRNN